MSVFGLRPSLKFPRQCPVNAARQVLAFPALNANRRVVTRFRGYALDVLLAVNFEGEKLKLKKSEA